MFKCIRRYLCCCGPLKQNAENNILIKKNKVNNKKDKKSVSFDINSNKDKDKNKNKNKDNNRDNNRDNDIINNSSYLQNISYKDTELFIPQIRFAKVIKVYDGDTITVASKLPFNKSPIYRFSVRLRSIDSPEIKGVNKRECDLAIEARDALHKLIYGKIIEIRNNGKEKYGRLLADLYYNDIHINKWMVDNGYAVNYDGGKKSSF